MKCALLIALMIAGIASPATAEKFSTVWTLQDQKQVRPTTAVLDEVFFEQRVVPLRLVQLSEPLALGKDKQLAKGTMLYLILDKSNRMAFCTFKDSSVGNVSKSFFIPALDTRPCLIDDDRDGKFEKSFTVFDLWGSVVPIPKGDMRKAQQVTAVSYADIDPITAPNDYRLRFKVHGKGTDATPGLRFSFSGKNDGGWMSFANDKASEGSQASPFNYDVKMTMLGTNSVQIMMEPNGKDIMVVLADRYEMQKTNEFPKTKAKK